LTKTSKSSTQNTRMATGYLLAQADLHVTAYYILLSNTPGGELNGMNGQGCSSENLSYTPEGDKSGRGSSLKET